MNSVCIIPARGGSKRIPKKNIQNFLGRPIITYSIETAIKSKLFEEVMVSTDDDEVVEVAKKYGAKVPFMRSEENANDFATLSDVVEEIKKNYIEQDQKFKHICLLLPTAPFVTVALLKEAYELLQKKDVDSVRPVVRFSYPIQRAFKRDEKGKVEMMYTEYTKSRSQDLEIAYHDAGMFYFMKWESGLLGEKKYAIETLESECHDIDTPEDWKLAELKYKHIRSNNLE